MNNQSKDNFSQQHSLQIYTKMINKVLALCFATLRAFQIQSSDQISNALKCLRRSITVAFVVCAVLLFPSCQEEKVTDSDAKHAHEHKDDHGHTEDGHDDKDHSDHEDKKSKKHKEDESESHAHEDADDDHENDETEDHAHEDGHDHKKNTQKKDDHAKDDHGHAEGGHDDHGEGGGEFGPGKGVEQYDEKKGIVLGALATKRFKVAVTPVSKLTKKGNNWIIPASALIEEENDKGLYIKKGDWYQFIKIQVVAKSRYFVEVRARLQGAESIVTKSVAFVRLAELNASGASGEGHGH